MEFQDNHAMKYYVFLTLFFCLFMLHATDNVLCLADHNTWAEESDNDAEVEAEEGKWTGIDVSIVGKYAEKYGHPPRDPYINTDQGDLLLFVFTLAGLVGGIIIGYNFRKLFVEGKDKINSPQRR
jgi:hypothetical protein